MSETARLRLPLMLAGQAQKHVTFNEALAMLDLLVGVIPVKSRSLDAPPPGAADGDVHILAAAGTGVWLGFGENDLALRIDGGWRRVLPSPGMLASIADEDARMAWFDGAVWNSQVAGTPGVITEIDDFAVGVDHFGNTLRFGGLDDITATLPNDAPVGSGFSLLQAGAGAVTFAPETGATLNHAEGHNRSGGTWTSCALLVESNLGGFAASWVLSGATQPAGNAAPSGILVPFVDWQAGAYVFDGETFGSETAFLTAIGGSYGSTGQIQFGPMVPIGSPELLTNGDFASGSVPGWGTQGSTIAVVGGELEITGTGLNGSGAFLSIAGLVATSGRAYRLAGKVRRGTASSATLGIGGASGGSTANYAQTANLTNTSMASVALYCGGFHASTPTIAARYLVNPANGTYYVDDLSLQEALPYAGFTAGELAGIVEATTPNATGADRVVFQADDNAEFNGNWFERNFIRLVWDASGHLRFIVSFGGTGAAVEQANIDLGVVPVSTAFAVAFSAKANQFQAAILGRPVQIDTAGSVPGIAGIRLGKGRSLVSNLWTGSIERLRLYAKAASPNEFLGIAGAGGIAAWGDSLTAGAGATGGSTGSATYPAVAQTLFSPARAVVNLGFGGQTSTQIAARMNAQPIAVTLAGNLIPASGGVAVTAKSINVLTNSGAFTGTQIGWIGGVKGTMSTDASGNWTFTRDTPGGAVAVDPGAIFTTELGQVLKSRTAWLWLGRNGAQAGYTVEGDIAAAVASLGHTRYLVGSILPSSADSAGGLSSLAARNTALANIYDTRFVNVLAALQAAGNGSSDDNADIAAGLTPRSLRSDTLHLNDAGYAVAAAAFKARHTALGF